MGIAVPHTLSQQASGTLLGDLLKPQLQWLYYDARFLRLFQNMTFSRAQIEDYQTKLAGLQACLNKKYWPLKGPNDITFIISGSGAKGTAVRTCSDIDVIFLLPHSVYERFALRTGNIQSALLQEIKQTLLSSLYSTDIKGDAPTVVVDFSTVKVEIAPAFLDLRGSPFISDSNFKTWVCHTKNNGRYALTAPAAEVNFMNEINRLSNSNLVPLIRMLKVWKKHCNVSIKSIAIQMMAERFISAWYHKDAGYFWADWLLRDFFSYMATQKNGYGFFPVTRERISFGDSWFSKSESAAAISQNACIYEQLSYNALAGEQWQKLLGTMIPKEA